MQIDTSSIASDSVSLNPARLTIRLGPAFNGAQATSVIRAIHRHNDYVCFAQIGDGRIKTAAARGDEVNVHGFTLPPDDFYVAINGMRTAKRDDDHCSQFNAIAIDIDLHDDPSPARIAATVERIEREWQNLRWSIMVISGRGIWLIWLLREDGSDRSIPVARNDRQLRDRVKRLHDAIAAELPVGIEADPVAGGLSGLMRIPNSHNSLARGRSVVTFSVVDDSPYTLSELERAFDVTAQVMVRAVSDAGPAVAVPVAKCPAKRKGKAAMLSKRERGLDELILMRRGIREGARSSFALILASTTPSPARLEHFGQRQCVPALSAAQIRSTLRDVAKKPRKFTNVKIGKWLRITTEENEALVAAGHGDFLNARKLPAIKRAAMPVPRREAAKKYFRVGMKLSELQALIKGIGIEASERTLRRDLKALDQTLAEVAA